MGQTNTCREVILVDDGSMPPIVGVDNLADTRGRTIRHDNNRGAAAARNLGICAARSSVLAFLDSKDVWYPLKFDEQLTVLKDGNPYGVVIEFDLRDRIKYTALGLILQTLEHVPSSSCESRAPL